MVVDTDVQWIAGLLSLSAGSAASDTRTTGEREGGLISVLRVGNGENGHTSIPPGPTKTRNRLKTDSVSPRYRSAVLSRTKNHLFQPSIPFARLMVKGLRRFLGLGQHYCPGIAQSFTQAQTQGLCGAGRCSELPTLETTQHLHLPFIDTFDLWARGPPRVDAAQRRHRAFTRCLTSGALLTRRLQEGVRHACQKHLEKNRRMGQQTRRHLLHNNSFDAKGPCHGLGPAQPLCKPARSAYRLGSQIEKGSIGRSKC